MKKLSMLLGLTLLFISITACSKPIEDKTVGKNDTPLNSAVVEDSDIAQLPATRIVTDHFERQVEIPSEIERVAIVYLLPLPSVMAVYQGGNVDNLVGMPPDSLNAAENSILARYSPDILNVSTKFYEGGQINMEELLNLNPDVVFFTGPPNAAQFEAAGIPAIGFSTTPDGTSPLNTLNAWLTLLDDVLQKESNTDGIIEYGKKVEKMIGERVKDLDESELVDVLMIGHYTDTALTPAGTGSFSEYWCEATGSINVALDANQATVNMEQVYEWAPEMVFLSTLTSFFPEDLYNNTAAPGHDWSNVPAIQTKQVHKFPLGMHRWWPPSSDAPLSLLWIAKTTYPQLFEDIDMAQTTKDYYKDFYGMELTDEDIEWIFNPREDLGRKFN